MSDGGKDLSVLGHIDELRRRLVKSVIAIAIGAVISFIFRDYIIYILKLPAGDVSLQAIEMTEMMGTYMRVSLIGGIILTMPYLTYHLIMFVSPALTRKEKKHVYIILPWIALMFAAGVVFSYFILVPPATRFLLTFGSSVAEIQPRVGNYINLISRLLLAMGLVFEMPVITTFLTRIGVLKPKWLSDKRKIAIIFSFVLAAIITPTFDPINQILVAIPLVALYELSILLSRIVYRKKADVVTPASSPAS